MSCIRTVGLIPSAGLSTRMGGFKPLLPLGASNIIRTAVNSLQSVCEQVVVVTGRDAELVEEQFSDMERVVCIHNPGYADSPMFSSVCIGLDYLRGRGERVFILPCDTPLIRKYTLETMIKYMCVTAASAVKPVMDGVSGHPVAIDMHIAESIIGYSGDGGLKGALSDCCKIHSVSVADEGIHIDTDTQEDYAALCAYFKRRGVPTRGECEAALALVHTPKPVIQHCEATAKTALCIAIELTMHGKKLDAEMIYAAAMLHDICRTQTDHAAAGAALLRDMGFHTAAGIVEQHMEIERPEVLDECAVVYYADKITQGTERISLDEKRRRAEDKTCGDEVALLSVRRRIAAAETIEKNISRILS